MILTTGALFVAGIAAAGIPIVVHLLMRGKPKKTVFPALRFTKARIAATNRRLKAKRFLLLALRVAFCVLLGLTLARPFFQPSRESGENAPTGQDAARATLVVVDASPRMARVKNNATLFEKARETASAIVSQAPAGSEIAILSSGSEGDAFLPDRFAAKERLEKLAISTTGRSAGESLAAAIELSSKASLGAREIFVLTDGAKAGWTARDFKAIRRAYENASPPPTVYYLDLGDASYRNASITDATLASETIAEGNALRLDVAVERVAEEAGVVVLETLIFDASAIEEGATVDALVRRKAEATRRETRELKFDSGRARRECAFNIAGLPSGTQIGVVHIVGADALAVDDARSFVAKVETERKALVVAPDPAEDSALFLTQALAPDELATTGRAPFQLATIPYENATTPGGLTFRSATIKDLSEYQAIFLLDPTPFDAETLEKLSTYVKEGGGLGVFLGRNFGAKVGYEKADPTALLGCNPTSIVSTKEQVAEIAPRGYDFPILGTFRNYARLGIPWDALPTRKYWRLDAPTSSATIVADFQNDYGETRTPALVENEFGLGLVATLATPISDHGSAEPWNDLAAGDGAWVFIELMDGIAGRLASGSASILNYATGELASIRSPVKDFPATVTISTPSGDSVATSGDVERRRVRFPGAKEPGVYRVKSDAKGGAAGLDEAFATAMPGEVFDMTRYDDAEWKELWGDAAYSTLDPDSILGEIAKARREESREPYAFFAVALAALFLCETWVSDRFYKS